MADKCRWCDLMHGPMCPAVKAIEFADDGVTVKRVEFKTMADCWPPVFQPLPPPLMPSNPFAPHPFPTTITWGGVSGSCNGDVGQNARD